MNISISWKIFALVTALLTLLTAVALLSLVRVGHIRDRVLDVAETHLPITRQITVLLEAALNQDLQLERSRVLMDLEGGRVAAEYAWGRYLDFDRSGSAALRQAQAYALQGRERSATEAERLAFAGLQVELRVLDEEIQDLRSEGLAITALFAAEPTSRTAVELRHHLAHLTGLRQHLAPRARKVLSGLEQTAADAASAAEVAERQSVLWNMAITMAAALLGLASAYALARGLTQPLLRLLHGIKEVESGHLEIDIPPTTRDEIGQLTGAFNHMTSEIRQKARILETFGQYMDPRIVRRLVGETGTTTLRSERHEMTVMFSDLAGYTSLSELMMPPALVGMLNEFLDLSVIAVKEHSGIIDKFIGDSVMAFWGPPFCEPGQHSQLACQAVLRQIRDLPELNRRVQAIVGLRTALPALNIRFGIATGEVVVGNVGPVGAKSFTVIGETANLAQRLEQANKLYGTSILISEPTYRMLDGGLPAREVDQLRVKGISQAVRVYQLLNDEEASRTEALGMFAEGLTAYRRGDWVDARRAWQAGLREWPEDPVARKFSERLEELATRPPRDWDGAWPPTAYA